MTSTAPAPATSAEDLSWMEVRPPSDALLVWREQQARRLAEHRARWASRPDVDLALSRAEQAPSATLPTVRGAWSWELSRRPGDDGPVVRVRRSGTPAGHVDETVVVAPRAGPHAVDGAGPAGLEVPVRLEVAPDGGRAAVEVGGATESGRLLVLERSGVGADGLDRPVRRSDVVWDEAGTGLTWVHRPGDGTCQVRRGAVGRPHEVLLDGLADPVVVRLCRTGVDGTVVAAVRHPPHEATEVLALDAAGARVLHRLDHRVHPVRWGGTVVGLTSTPEGSELVALADVDASGDLRTELRTVADLALAGTVTGLAESGASTRPGLLVVGSSRGSDQVWHLRPGSHEPHPLLPPGSRAPVAVHGLGRDGDHHVLVSTSTPVQPAQVRRLPLRPGRTPPAVRRPPPTAGDGATGDGAEHRTLRATSADGTEVDVTLVMSTATAAAHRRSLPAPVLLSCYGGFGVASTAAYDPGQRAWVDLGGIYATAHVRGGGEKGPSWHRAGRGRDKQRAVDDLLAAAHLLVARGWAPPGGPVLVGASHGGTLVLAAALERPDLVSAVVATAPLTDLERLDAGGMGRWWTGEFGDPADARDLAALRALSPLRRARARRPSPPTLVAVGHQDARVPAWHGEELVAVLAREEGATALLRGDGSGHGASPLRVVHERSTDVLAFALAWSTAGGSTSPDG